MGTIYAPGSSQGTYYKKVTAAPAAAVRSAVMPAAGGGVGQQPINQQLTANGIPQGTMTMGPTGSISRPGEMGAGYVSGSGAGFQSTIGQQPQGGGIYGGQFYGGSQGGGGPTVYGYDAQAPAPPELQSQQPSFMTQKLNGYTASVRTNTPTAGGAGGSGGTGQAVAPADGQGNQQQLAQIATLIQGLTDKANAANEGRYQQLLTGADQMGQTAMQGSQRVMNQQLAGNQASLINRGLGNSTIVDTTNRGIHNDAANRNVAINENVAQNKQGIIERRTDQAPDLGMYAQLLSSAGGSNVAQALLAALNGSAKKRSK